MDEVAGHVGDGGGDDDGVDKLDMAEAGDEEIDETGEERGVEAGDEGGVSYVEANDGVSDCEGDGGGDSLPA